MKTAKILLGVLFPLSVMIPSMPAQNEVGHVYNISVAPGQIGRRHAQFSQQQWMEFQVSMMERSPAWKIVKGRNHSALPPDFQWEQAPVPERLVTPVYPFSALQAAINGKTQLKFVVGPDGKVAQAQIVQTTTPEMGQAVLAMIDAWRFEPAKKEDGTPASAILGLEVEFNPSGFGDAPVTRSARDILGLLQKHPDEIVPSTELDAVPKPISRPSPVYPLASHQLGKTGSAMIGFFIDEEGNAQLPSIISSSAPEFGYAAVQAVADWRFEAPKKAGKAVVTRVEIPVEFKEELGPLALAH